MNKSTSDLKISERFRREITLHVAKNLLNDDRDHHPLILGIHGPSGEGKTFQCEYVLHSLGVNKFLISGGQLESPDAGQPANLIRSTYLRAGKNVEGHWQPSALLLNDIDTGLGHWGDLVQYTVNRQTVLGELMHLADYPSNVDGRATRRIPIIVTGNDFTRLYQPLIRAGRMRLFEWVPTLEEKVDAIHGIFNEIDRGDCEILFRRLQKSSSKMYSAGPPLAFFGYLRSTLHDDALWCALQERGLKDAIVDLSLGRLLSISYSPTLDLLISQGIKLIEAGRLSSHIGER